MFRVSSVLLLPGPRVPQPPSYIKGWSWVSGVSCVVGFANLGMAAPSPVGCVDDVAHADAAAP